MAMYCPVCNSCCFEHYRKIGKFSILQCAKCSHAILDGDAQANYDGSYFTSHYQYPKANTVEFIKKIKQQKHRIKKIRSLNTSGLLLDIGCGLGHFLYAANEIGYSVYGYDFVDENSSYIIDILGINIHTGDSIRDIDKGKFDIVTSWHSLEHSEDPNAYLQSAREVLGNKGFFVVEVPTYDSIDAFITGASWPGWDPPFHRQHFSRSSLYSILENNGFRVIKEYTYHCDHVRNILNQHALSFISRPISKLFRGGSVACVCKRR